MQKRRDELKYESVLNADSFDKRRFGEIYNQSKKLQEINERGSQTLPSFTSLMGDIWSSLFKTKPKLLEDTPDHLSMNRVFMDRIMKEKAFHEFRDVSMLDDLMSAIGTSSFSHRTLEWLQEEMNHEMQKLMDDAQQQQQLNQQAQQQLEQALQALRQAMQNMEQNPQDTKALQKAKKKVSQVKRQAQRAQQDLNQVMQQLAKELQQRLDDTHSSINFSKAIEKAIEETKQAKEDLTDLAGGLKAGSGESELKKIPLRDQITIAETLKNNRKFREVANWAGRFKKIARKKQKSKSKESILRSGVTLGNKPERLLPTEILLMKHKTTRLDFLRRFAEGQTFQYEQRGKETMGKGPIICCLDQSASMHNLKEQASGFVLALMMVARQQRRDFAYIPFDSKARQAKIYKKGKISLQEMLVIATEFLDGGTDFQSALAEALSVMKGSLKKGDIIFVTDGRDKVNSAFLEKFNKMKKEKGFNVMSIIINQDNDGSLGVEPFSDKVIFAKDFIDGNAHEVFTI